MDPLTVFLIATLMMLLNGGVLGLIHRDLPAALRPAAVSWRIGTLLQAGGCILLAVQAYLPPGFILPLANGMLMLGITGYWRALRQFYGRPDRWLMLLPLLLGTLGVWWFAAVSPDLATRVWIASLSWLCLLLGGGHELYRAGRAGDPALSRKVLMGILAAVSVFMLVRALAFALVDDPGQSILDFRSVINMLTPLLASILPVIGTTAFLLLCSDRIRRQWEQAASTDDLTGLPNRRTIATAGAQRLALARRQGLTLAVAIIDIDHFKRINDQLGHDVGDQALKQVAQCIEHALRSVDLPGRQGGEEFVALLAVHDAAEARQIAERLREAVRDRPFCSVDGMRRTITVSIGVTTLQASDTHLDDLLRRADRALYVAKDAGRDRVELA